MAMGLNLQEYVKAFFTIAAYHKTYENAILHPLTHDYSQPQLLELSDSDQEDIEDNDDDDSEMELEDKSVLPPATRRPPQGQRNVAFAVLARQTLPLAVNTGRISVNPVEGLGTIRGLARRPFNCYLVYLIHN